MLSMKTWASRGFIDGNVVLFFTRNSIGLLSDGIQLYSGSATDSHCKERKQLLFVVLCNRTRSVSTYDQPEGSRFKFQILMERGAEVASCEGGPHFC